MYEYVIVIGRFQPCTNAHRPLVQAALEAGKNVIVVLGSHNQAWNILNPWTSAEREQMIRACFSAEEGKRLHFVYAKDYQSNMMWLASVQSAIDAIVGESKDIKLIGHKKDATSFYLDMFPQWGDHIEFPKTTDIDATAVRNSMFRQDKITIKGMVPKPVYDYLSKWMETPCFETLHGEFQEVASDQAAWDGAPYQPTFVTTDAVVICSGHVLVIRRGGKYGKGLIAWPGGYIKATEYIIDSCIRELKEETGIKVDRAELKKLVVDKDVFDNPRRDLRGRMITHAFCIKLPDGPLPKVKGMDDADKAWWMAISDFHAREAEFFADHYKIGCRFTTRF